jgi:hypothetical protein
MFCRVWEGVSFETRFEFGDASFKKGWNLNHPSFYLFFCTTNRTKQQKSYANFLAITNTIQATLIKFAK